MLRKGVHPYDYVDCIEKLDETSLSPKEAFYSKFTGEGITDEDYQHAQTVWKNLILSQGLSQLVQSVSCTIISRYF